MIDFEELNRRLLARANELLPQWLPGGRWEGHEYLGARRRDGGPGDSLRINCNTGKWAQFNGGTAKGGDCASLYAWTRGLSQIDAARELSEAVGLAETKTNGLAPRPTQEPATPPFERPPDDAPSPPAHSRHGAANATYAYRDSDGVLYYTTRYNLPAGKVFSYWTWHDGRWQPKAPPAPRALYGLWEVQARTDAPVLIVEGEKCRDAAATSLLDYVAVSWPGGASSVKHADWSALRARTVVIWPDADVPGRQAAASVAAMLLPIASSVHVIDPAGKPEGWDVADAVAEELPADFIADWMHTAARTPNAPRETNDSLNRFELEDTDNVFKLKVGRPHSGPAPVDTQPHDNAYVSRQSLGLECNNQQQPYPTLSNLNLILTRHPAIAAKIWFDTFRGKIFCSWLGDPRPWEDADDLRLTAWVQQTLLMPKIGVQLVANAVQLVAANNCRNSVTEWLESLEWDQEPRLDDWLDDIFGVEKTAYTIAVSRKWLICMVARAYQPGCQADHMPVLEGGSGRGKSSALGILGGEWYRASPQAFGSKEFFEVIQGAWLIEIPDMVGFGRREHTQIISAITTRADAYRNSYGRHAGDHPRTAVFCATSETDEYLKDSRGKRRYWPLRCADIDRDLLTANRDQLFAEALVAYKAGEDWYKVPEAEALAEQTAREEADIWLDKISNFVALRESTTVAEVAEMCLEIRAADQDHSDMIRISKCLKYLGYSCKVEWHNKAPIRVYRCSTRYS